MFLHTFANFQFAKFERPGEYINMIFNLARGDRVPRNSCPENIIFNKRTATKLWQYRPGIKAMARWQHGSINMTARTW